MGAIGWWVLAAIAAPAGDELVVRPDEPIAAVVGGHPARLLVGSGRLDRLTLDPRWIAVNGLEPAAIGGGAELEVGGRREFKGHYRPLALTVDGRTVRARAFWFERAPPSAADGSIGPWGLPQSRVTFVLARPAIDETEIGATLATDRTASYSVIRIGDGAVGLSFDLDDPGRYPVASAAAGALLARTLGGGLSGASWDVDILMGVRRPVRLLTLARPLVVGTLRFGQVAVRVRDRVDASGRGGAIPEAGAAPGDDPDEIEVVGRTGRTPNYTLSLPRAALARCSSLTFDKAAKRIALRCR